MRQQMEAVRRMQDYIALHLHEPLSLGHLAQAAQYSPWYAYRLFTKWLHCTPAEYIRRYRLSQAALRLRDTEDRVLEIAMDAGFSSPEGFQRAFYREFGCNPAAYARQPMPIPLFIPYPLYIETDKEHYTMNKNNYVFLQVITKPARKVLIRRGINARDYMEYCHEVGCEVWGLLLSMPSISPEPVSMWLPQKYQLPGTSQYVQGVEVALDYDGPIPEQFDVITLPEAKYLQFQGQPFPEESFQEAIHDIWAAIDAFDPTTIGYRWDTTNPRIQLAPLGQRGYIELMPIC